MGYLGIKGRFRTSTIYETLCQMLYSYKLILIPTNQTSIANSGPFPNKHVSEFSLNHRNRPLTKLEISLVHCSSMLKDPRPIAFLSGTSQPTKSQSLDSSRFIHHREARSRQRKARTRRASSASRARSN